MTAKEQAAKERERRLLLGLQALPEEHPAWRAMLAVLEDVEEEIRQDLDIPTVDVNTNHKLTGMAAGVRRVRHRLGEWREAEVKEEAA